MTWNNLGYHNLGYLKQHKKKPMYYNEILQFVMYYINE
jgi:hypothetical protein